MKRSHGGNTHLKFRLSTFQGREEDVSTSTMSFFFNRPEWQNHGS